MSEVEFVEKIAISLGKKDYRELCNILFGETGKGKKKKDFCKMCKMSLPKSNSFINYSGQMTHIKEYHNLEEISQFLKISIKEKPKIINKSIDITNYNEVVHKLIIKELLEEFENMNIKITVEKLSKEV
jgi:cytochrome c